MPSTHSAPASRTGVDDDGGRTGLIEDVVAGNEVAEEAVTALRARIDALPPIEIETREEATVVMDPAQWA